MKKDFLAIILVMFFCLNIKAQEIKNASNIEPKTTFEILINDKKYLISEGEVLTLDTVISKPSISIKLSDNKKFDNSSISFQYPKHLSFDFEQDFGYKNWTFSGNSLVIMLFEMDAKTSLNNLIDEMIKTFGKKNCSIEDFQKELGHKKWNGKRLGVSLVGTKLTLDFYEIILPGFKSRFIAFQNSLEDDGSSTEEYKRGFSVKDSTMTYQ